MCGIALTIDLRGEGRAAPWALEAIRHRGPDGEGVFEDPGRNVALEHTRLAIIDPDNPWANQPFLDPSGRWSLVYNGEIFNFRELRADLERRGVRFQTDSDTEVVLLGFIDQGERLLSKLRGMFAFAIWDAEERTLFAARDQLGVKPFYYAESDGILAACSELRPLLSHPRFRGELDPESVVEHLAFGHTFGERTLVRDLKKLPPGHFLRARDGRVTVDEYWDVLPPDAPRGPSPDELRGLLEDAVTASLVSDVPLGLMLSGGLDSSTVAVLAARHADPQTLTGYSVSFGQPDDETPAAAALAEQLGMRFREVRVTKAELEAEFDGWLGKVDVPSGNPTWIASWFTARAARADGIKVLLSGDGGDELFGGYNRWMKYLRFDARLWSPAPEPVLQLAGAVAGRFAGGLAGDIARRARHRAPLFVPSRPFHDDLLARCLGPAGAQAAARRPPETHVQELYRRFRARHDGDSLGWMAYSTLRTKLVEDFLGRLDKMGMQHAVEGRVPLLDPHLSRWALGVPQATMVPGFRQKAFFREAVRPLLPRSVMARPKQGFCPPVATWAADLLVERGAGSAGTLVERGLVRPAAVAEARRSSPFAAWTLVLLEDWIRASGSALG